MNRHWLAALALPALLFLRPTAAFAWAQDGHSIIAEIAQRHLSANASRSVASVLGRGHSLASVSSWADEVRDSHPETANWHFVNIPVAANDFRPARDCPSGPRGDCIVAELERLASELRCAPTRKAKREALMYAAHFVADLHQPLHTVGDATGGNDIMVELRLPPRNCRRNCAPRAMTKNFHAVWDETLISGTVWNWGAYVARLESGWLKHHAMADASGSVRDWALDSHAVAQRVWKLLPPTKVIDEDYYRQALPLLDRQLGIAGLRLARFLNEAYGSKACLIRGRSPN
jgi:hypothetical protein